MELPGSRLLLLPILSPGMSRKHRDKRLEVALYPSTSPQPELRPLLYSSLSSHFLHTPLSSKAKDSGLLHIISEHT